MKKIIVNVVLAALAMGAITETNAQNTQKEKPKGGKMDGKGAGDHAAKKLEMMKKDLNLSADQEVKVKQVFDDEEKSRKAEMANKSESSKEDMKTKMDAQKANSDAKLKAILTDEQYKKYQEKEAEMKKNKPSGGHHAH